VNMRAIDEYNEVELRLSDLQGKRDTLFTEREQLLERIDQYEKLKRDAFMEAYTSINANFREIFTSFLTVWVSSYLRTLTTLLQEDDSAGTTQEKLSSG